MKIKDLKVGMKVWIRTDLKVGEKYGSDIFVEDMKYLTGLQQVTIIGNKIIQVDGWHFTSEMIDWDKTEKLNNKRSMLFYDGTTLKGQINGKEIKVVRSSKDKEDLEKAVMMGLLKSLGYSYKDVKKLQSKVKEVWKPKFNQIYYYVGPYGEVKPTRNLNHDFDKKLFEICNYFKTKEEAEKELLKLGKYLRNRRNKNVEM